MKRVFPFSFFLLFLSFVAAAVLAAAALDARPAQARPMVPAAAGRPFAAIDARQMITGTIGFGQTVTGTLSVLGEEHAYTFSGNSGDVIHLVMSRPSGSLDPQFDVYDPTSTRLCGSWTSGVSRTLDCTLASTGIYTIIVSDYFDDETGPYQLYLQRLNNPTSATAINFDDIASGATAQIVEKHTYTFGGASGDVVRFDLSRTSGTLDPRFDVYNPNGTRLCGTWTSAVSVYQENCLLDLTGTYTVLVGDYNSDETGSYQFTLQRLNNPTGAVALAFNDVISGTTAQIVEKHAYTFGGASGDVVRFDLSRTSGALDPRFDVYNPNGTRLCGTWTTNISVYQDNCVLDVTGTYTVLAGDYNSDGTGSYQFTLQRLNNPTGATPVTFGDIAGGSTTQIVEKQAYTFSGGSGDVVQFVLSWTSGALQPRFDVYNPNGTRLCGSWTSGTSAFQDCTLDVTGTYTVLIGDYNGDATGSYQFTLQRLNNPTGAVTLAYNDIISGTTTQIVEKQAYTISGGSGDVVRFDLSRTSGVLDPRFDVYNPNGVRLCGSWTSSISVSQECTFDLTGAYTILIGDNGGDETGSYQFTLQRLNNPTGATLVAFNDIVDGTITQIVEKHAYTFSGNGGDVVQFVLSRTSGTLGPRFDVYNPDGARLCGTWTSSISVSQDCTLNSTGTHTILIGDNGDDEIGSYQFTLQRLNNPTGATAITFDDFVEGAIAQIVEKHVYTFSGNGGDVVKFIMRRPNGSLDPQFDVYSPDGTRLCGNLTTGTTVSRDCALDQTGTFTILLGDYGSDETGPYQFYLQRLNDPAGATAITFGDIVSGSIAVPVEKHTFTFAGAAGDVVQFITSRPFGVLDVQLDVYGPGGTRLCGTWTSGASLSLDCTLDRTGTFTLLLGDYFADETGPYQFYLQRLNNPAGATAITFGDIVSGTTAVLVEKHTYTFAGATGDVVQFIMGRPFGVLDPEFDVYNPDGTRLCGTWTSGIAVSQDCMLDQTGTFTILLGDYFVDETGPYQFYLQRLNDPVGATHVAFDNAFNDTITLPVEKHTYTFSAGSGDTVKVTMSRPAGVLDPQFDVYRPNGTRLCGNVTTAASLSLECTLDITGTHTLLVGDYGNDEIGSYRLQLQGVGQRPPVDTSTTVTPETGGTLVYTDTQGLRTTVEVPANAVTETVQLNLTSLITVEQSLPAGVQPTNRAFDLFVGPAPAGGTTLYLPLLMYDSTPKVGGGAGFNLLKPATITIHYGDADVLGIDENGLRLLYWNGSGWVDAATTCVDGPGYSIDATQNVLRLSICHLSRYIMVG